MKASAASPIVFYDGTCGMCNIAVQQVLRYDRKGLFLFAPLQGETAKALPDWTHEANSLVLLEHPDTELRIRSSAVFRICWLMGGAWAAVGVLSFLPASLFDWGYRIIANNRHRFFGTDEACRIPSTAEKKRFLP